MKKLSSKNPVKLFSFNTEIVLIDKIKSLATKRDVSQGYLVTEIFTTYFELLKELSEVNYEN